MLVNAAINSGNGYDPLQTASARAQVGTVSDAGLSAVLRPLGKDAPRNPVVVDGATSAAIVDLSAERQQADQLRVGIGAVQEDYQKLVSAEAAQQEVRTRVAEIQATVREAAATSDDSVREELRSKVAANLQAIEAAAGALQAETSAGAASGGEDAQAAIASTVNQQRMVAEAAVYLITSESGSRTVRVVTGGDGGALTEANTLLGDFDMHLRSLGGEVYIVPNYYRESALQRQDASSAAEAAQAAVSQSGISGRITVNGRPYNLLGLGGLTPQQVANLASIAAESGGLKEAVQDSAAGKDAQDVARENSFSDEGRQAPSGSSAGSEEQQAEALSQLPQIVESGAAVEMTVNPAGALQLADQALIEAQERSEGLTERLRQMAQASTERVDRLLSAFTESLGEIADETAASETTGRVAQQILRAEAAAYPDDTGIFRNAYELLQVI